MRFDAKLGEPFVFKGQPREELDNMWDSPVDRTYSSALNTKLAM